MMYAVRYMKGQSGKFLLTKGENYLYSVLEVELKTP
jgi:hypothetical protein